MFLSLDRRIARALGLNPEEILTKEALAKPHRTVVSGGREKSQDELDTLLRALKKRLMEELMSEMPRIAKTV